MKMFFLSLFLLASCTPTTSPHAIDITGRDTARVPTVLLSPLEADDGDPAEGVVAVSLSAAPASYEHAGIAIDGYAYNGQVPGPTIRAQLGDTVRVTLTNDLDDPTTIHWHGVHVPWDMDGVTWMQDPVGPGESFVYTFTVNQAGSFWYHPHFDTDQQVDLGLYGALIVEDPAEPRVDREYIAILDAVDELNDPLAHHGLAGADPTWTVNGMAFPLIEAQPSERIRIRWINASNIGYAALSYPDWAWLGADQGLHPTLQRPDQIVLAPGDRADTSLQIIDTDTAVTMHPYTLLGGAAFGSDFPLVAVTSPSSGTPTAEPAWPFPGGEVSADPTFTDVTWVFQGDPRSETWFINNEVFPDITVRTASLGSRPIVEVRNLSGTEHPFHLHGTAFEVLSMNGVPSSFQTIADTVNVPVGAAIRLMVHADNPGEWMAHCHILPHADGGMMTVLNVE